MLIANISGISHGLKNTEANAVNFVKAEGDQGIDTLHIVYEGEPKVHKGLFIKATELGAPDPTAFEEGLFHWFYQRNPIEGLNVPWDVKNAQFVYSISVEDDERMKKLFPSIRRAIRRYDANLGSFEDSMLGVANTFKNMDVILKAPCISQISNKFRAGILISAGPSLDLEWQALRKAANSRKFLIVACDVVIKKCLKEGVKPHVVVTTERVPGSEEFFKGLTQEDVDGITLTSTVMAYRPVIDLWPGKKAFILRKDYPAHWYPFKNRKWIWSAPSVAPTGLGVMGIFGIKDVAFVGQDLCLTKEGVSHTKFTEENEKERKEMEKAERERAEQDNDFCETYSGEKRRTTNTWNVMRGDMTTVTKQWGMTAISTSWHGSKIVDIPFKQLAEWIDERSRLKEGELLVPISNPNEAWETAQFKSKKKQAIEFLVALEDKLEEYQPDHFTDLPHFRELCFTSVQRAYVTYLNKRFQQRGDKHEFCTLFRAEALSAIREVLEILEG